MLKCQRREGWGWLFVLTFLLFSWLFVVGFLQKSWSLPFLILCQNRSLISPSPSNPSRWRSLSDFSSTSLSVPHLLITILTRQSPKPFVKGLKKPSAGQYPRAHTSPVITPQSLAQTLCAWSWYNHIQPLPTVFHDRSKKKPKQTAATA